MNSLSVIRVLRRKLFPSSYFEVFHDTLWVNDGIKKCNIHYSAEEQQKLLKKINESSSDDLQRFSITSKRLEHLQKCRTDVGGFSTVDQLLSVCGLGDKSVKKFLDSILCDGKKDQTTTTKTHNFLTPNIAESQRMKLQNVVAIHILGNSVTWAKINKDGLLSDWNIEELDLSWKKRHATNLLEEAYGIVKRLPDADVYVMEDNGNSAQHLKNNIVSALQSHQLYAMILTLLNSKENDGWKVFFLRHHLSARLFQTLVGKERISCQSIVQKLVDGEQLKGQEYLKFKVEPELRKLYYTCGNVEKEIMSYSLLLSITFLELVMLGRPESITAITSRKQV